MNGLMWAQTDSLARFSSSDSLRSSAHASITPDGKRLVVSNMTSGFDVYETDTGMSVGAITHPVAKLLAVPVTFAQNSCVIVGGSATGKAHIWDASTYDLQQCLVLEGAYMVHQ